MTASAGKRRNQKALSLVERCTINFHGCYNRQIVVDQFLGEGMLFQNLRPGPAVRAIELDDDRVCLFDAHLIDAVLVAVEREQT